MRRFLQAAAVLAAVTLGALGATTGASAASFVYSYSFSYAPQITFGSGNVVSSSSTSVQFGSNNGVSWFNSSSAP